MANIEKRTGKIESQIEKLSLAYKKYVEKMKAEGLPLDEKGRIDEALFASQLGKDVVQQDKDEVEKVTKSPDYIENNIGELAELLIPVLFNDFIGNKFLIFRTSIFDDIFNGADTIIVDKTTGKIVCAVDEASSIKSTAYKMKKAKINKKNEKGGVVLKYGITYNKGKIKLTTLEKVPLLILGFPLNEVADMISVINFDRPTEVEKSLFNFFVALINEQSSQNNFGFKLEQIV
jgi:hypothetical protein